MRYEPGKTHAWATAWGRGYAAEYANQGNRHPRFIKEKGRVVIFPTFQEAMAAAMTMIRKREPDVVGFAAAEDPLAAKLSADVAAFKDRRAEESRRLHSETFTMHKAGRKPVVVETKRRAG